MLALRYRRESLAWREASGLRREETSEFEYLQLINLDDALPWTTTFYERIHRFVCDCKAATSDPNDSTFRAFCENNLLISVVI
jgi:hypothetical protein